MGVANCAHPEHITMRPAKLIPSVLLVVLLLSSLPTISEGAVAIAVASGTTSLLSLTAAQVTGLAALKLLGVSAGLLLSRRGKREEPSNQMDNNSLLSLTSTLEPEECLQLLFCTLATEKVKIDSDVENIHTLVLNVR